jgi:hypothetical protein
MAQALVPEFDTERLRRQERFFLARAEAHLETRLDRLAPEEARLDPRGSRDHWHRACAANLTRHAAATALLRDDSETAVALFLRSGREYVSLGIFVGFSLLALCGPAEFLNRGHLYQYLTAQIGDIIALREHADHVEPQRAPFAIWSTASSMQLVHLYHALVSQGPLPWTDRISREQIRNELMRAPEVAIGATGIPLVRYVELLDRISEMRNGEQLRGEIRDTLYSAMLRRRDQLRAARADRWHWDKMLNPADIIDLTLLALSTTMIARRGDVAPLMELVPDQDPVVAIPFSAAEKLRSGW